MRPIAPSTARELARFAEVERLRRAVQGLHWLVHHGDRYNVQTQLNKADALLAWAGLSANDKEALVEKAVDCSFDGCGLTGGEDARTEEVSGG